MCGWFVCVGRVTRESIEKKGFRHDVVPNVTVQGTDFLQLRLEHRLPAKFAQRI